ncbi:MAG: phosphoribosylamine--glycine ligase [Vicinamibacterales bacterium]
MRVLVVGSGAREHALAARLGADPTVTELICAPGNPGMARVARLAALDVARPDAIVALASRERVDLTVIGPELPLSLGVVDQMTAAGHLVFGPTASAARLESSKAFAKSFMARHEVPSAAFRICETAEDAEACVRSGELGVPVVIKADGLAAGKGVVIAGDRAEAEAAISAAMRHQQFGAAGSRVVIEECLTGPEVSFFVIADGRRALPFATAQDHKRIFDDDKGPNTGGMGAFAPSPLVDLALHERIMREIVNPVIDGMAAEGSPFAGVLYVGLMLTASGPKVIEFNVRFGDPEAQVILPLLDEPLAPLLAASARGALTQSSCRTSSDRTVGVVMASRGYPASAESGRTIEGLDAADRLPGVTVLHAGTAGADRRIVTAGGRVLTVVGRGPSFADAIERAYAGVSEISFDGMQYRRDIGRKALLLTA